MARAAVRAADVNQGRAFPADSDEVSCDAELLDDTNSQKTSLLQQRRALVTDRGPGRRAAQEESFNTYTCNASCPLWPGQLNTAEFRCFNGKCLPTSSYCDGRKDCADGSDEMHCSNEGSEADSVASAKGQLYGRSQCQCIGISSEGTMEITVNGTSLEYPRATGAHCEAWDKQRHPDCQSSSSPSWCQSTWCYVDATRCNLAEADAPEVSLYIPAARFHGLPLYYSYATCSSTDFWTMDHNVEACSSQKREADCGRFSSKCAWTGTTCAGKELAASIPGDPAAVSEEFGQESCPCIGFSGISGSAVGGPYGRRDSVAYSASVGSSCQAWDKYKNSRCSGVVDAWWCKQSWCYVDPCTCTSARNVPRKAQLLPGGATIRGVPLFYSYETCGSMDAYSKTMNKASCPRHTTWHACGKAVDNCYWHSTMGCVSNVFSEYCGVTDQNPGSKTVLAQIFQTARKEKSTRVA